MANENKEIGEIVKKCKILLLDIEGTTTSISFVKDKLFPYAGENAKKFLESQWETDDVKQVVADLRQLAADDQKNVIEGVVTIPGEDASKDEQIEGLVKSVKWLMSEDRKAGALKQLQGLIWKQGYDAGDIKGHVYDDVSAALKAWQAMDDHKIYIYSSGSVKAQKLLFGQSLAGDLLKFIDGHFDTAVGAKQEAASYTNIVGKIGCKAEEVLFLTDIPKEAEAANAAGLQASLVSREGNAPLTAEDKAAFPVIHSMAELSVSNKRKPEPQEEEVPAKVPKTDAEKDVKTAAATVTTATATATTEPAEQMEVEDAPEEKQEDPLKEQIVVEEIDSNESTPATAVIDAEPVVTEPTRDDDKEKTDEKTEEVKEKANEKTKEPVPEETVEITDVTEVTDAADGKPLPDVVEAVEKVPIVEEPTVDTDMEELQNVGEVLEKECDEILSKVNNVTNIENISTKPSLNSIAEETMETENADSNDIVDRILDTEIDLEMQQCSDIDPKAVSEITEEAKTEKVEANGVKDASPTENVTEEKVEEVKAKVPENTPMEAEQKEKKEEVEVKSSETEITSTKETETAVEMKTIETEAKADVVEPESNTKTEEPATTVVAKEAKAPAPEEALKEEPKPEESKAKPKPEETITKEAEPEEKPTEKSVEVPKETIIEKDVEKQMNGTATNGTGNGDTVKMNGDSKENEINDRLAQNGKVNGSNSDSMDAEMGQGDCKVGAEVKDMKVKSVPAEETRTDPIEQPTEA